MFWKNSFEQKFVILHTLLNQGELSDYCLFIGLDDAYFNLRCLSNANRLFSEILSPKNPIQLSFGKKVYHDIVLVSFTATLPVINTNTCAREQISSPLSSKRNVFATKSRSFFGITYPTFRDFGMKWQALKDKKYFRSGCLKNVIKGFQKSMIVSSLPFRSG